MFSLVFAVRLLPTHLISLHKSSSMLPGKCGHAYFVPGFTNAGYSGKVVAVDLKTTALRSVRLHGVVTDFADFYSDAGVGPYDGQVGILSADSP